MRISGAALLFVGSLSACGADDPGTPPSGPPGGVLTVPGEAFAGAGAGGRLGTGGTPLESGGAPSAGGAPGDGGRSAGSGGITPSSGGSPAVAHCTGSATPCSLRTSSQCTGTDGCSMNGTCQGYSEFCSSQFYASSCYRVQGCVWSSYSNYCSGIAWTCDLFSGSATCTGQPGCSWQEDCSGAATPCDLLSEATCSTVPGCYVEYR